MGVLPGLILATLPVVGESVKALDSQMVVGLAFETYSVFTIPPPLGGQRIHIRIRVSAPLVWVDGMMLSPAEGGDFDLVNLNPRKPSRLTVVGSITQATLIETPRVFISGYEIQDDRGRLWVRNTLENTVNVYAAVSGSGQGQMDGSATVPPGSTQAVAVKSASGISGPPWRILLEKQEEAMEGGYQFVKTVDQRNGKTVNSYVKP